MMYFDKREVSWQCRSASLHGSGRENVQSYDTVCGEVQNLPLRVECLDTSILDRAESSPSRQPASVKEVKGAERGE